MNGKTPGHYREVNNLAVAAWAKIVNPAGGETSGSLVVWVNFSTVAFPGI
jgi:hypothetical protein